MNMSFNGGDAALVALAAFVSVVMSLVWLYIGFRAMLAHERLARAAEQMVRVPVRPASIPPL